MLRSIAIFAYAKYIYIYIYICKYLFALRLQIVYTNKNANVHLFKILNLRKFLTMCLIYTKTRVYSNSMLHQNFKSIGEKLEMLYGNEQRTFTFLFA